MTQTYERHVTVSTCARLINVHPTTIRRWIDEGKILNEIEDNKVVIPATEILRIKKDLAKQTTFISSEIDFRNLDETQQLDLLANRIDYLEQMKTQEALKEEVKKRKKELALAEQALRRIEEIQEEKAYIYQWPNKYLNMEVKNIPEINLEKRYNDLVKFNLISN